MPIRGWTVLGAPFDSSGAGRGEERAPAALREAGICAALGARDAGDAAPPLRGAERDPGTGLLALEDLRASSLALRDRVCETIGQDERPLVLGGDCSLLIGAIAGVRGALGRRCAMWFVDGHGDYLDGAGSPTGEAADMELAILTAGGPAGLADLAGEPPMIDPADVVVLGHRPPALSEDVGLELARMPAAIARMSAPEIEARGPAAVGERWARELAGRGPAWLHLDLDVLDERAMPAVTYAQPQGLGWASLVELLRPLLRSESLAGASVADLNPDLDEGGACARKVVEALARATA